LFLHSIIFIYYIMMSSTVRNALIASAIAVVSLSVAGITAYSNAQRIGEDSETAIAAAAVLTKSEFAELTGYLVPLTGMPGLAQMPPARVLMFAKRWRPRQATGAPRARSPGQAEALEPGLRLKTISAQKAFITEENAKREYKAQLGSGWTGFWLHVAGYPKRPLSK
jgi:hypothetical protein